MCVYTKKVNNLLEIKLILVYNLIEKNVYTHRKGDDMIERPCYLNYLIKSQNNGFPKVITGIRRCGKSYLLNTIFKEYLLEQGINNKNIIEIDLAIISNAIYRDPIYLYEHIIDLTQKNDEISYVFLDEIQEVYDIINLSLTNGKHIKAKNKDEDIIGFVDVILDLASHKNIDLYVTGSNSKMLSSDIITEFRDKATNIALYPLSFEEFNSYKKGYSMENLIEYLQYGGMPLAVLSELEDKKNYLKSLYQTTYFKDIIDRNKIQKTESLEELTKIISSCVGNLINVEKISNTYKSVKHEIIDKSTVNKYVSCFENAFLISSVSRYDLKGREEIGALRKYYFVDCGLRNAILNFSDYNEGQLLENLVFNELIYNGYSVNIGAFDSYGKNKDNITIRKNYEIDFYAIKGNKHLYIQVCDNYNSIEVKEREKKPYSLLNDQVQKIIVIKDQINETRDENGYTIIGIVDFLLRFIKY